MAKRIYLSSGDELWATEVSGSAVATDPGTTALDITSINGRAALDGDTVWVSVEGEVFTFEIRRSARQDKRGRDHSVFTSPMPATVVRIAVKPGDRVGSGDVLIALEAMKMELPIRAPRDGVVRAVNCREGELVQPDQELLEFE